KTRRDDCTTSVLPPAIAAKLFSGVAATTSNFTAGYFFAYHSVNRCPNSFIVLAPATRTTPPDAAKRPTALPVNRSADAISRFFIFSWTSSIVYKCKSSVGLLWIRHTSPSVLLQRGF